MKITNHKNAQTKQEKLEFINDFIEFFTVEYSISNVDRKFSITRNENCIAVLPMDKNYIIYTALEKANDCLFLIINRSYINEKNTVLPLSNKNGNTVNKNYKQIMEFAFKWNGWNGLEEKFEQFLFQKILAKYPEKGTKTKMHKI